MMYGIVKSSSAPIWEIPEETQVMDTQSKYFQTAIADEALCGMGLAVIGREEKGYYPVRTHYGYTGYIRKEELRPMTLEELQGWEASRLMVVNGLCADVTTLPRVQGVILQSLYRGALVKVLELDSQEKAGEDIPGMPGWARVELADGRIGYMRNQFLIEKKYSQAGLWESELPQCFLEAYRTAPSLEMEEAFRKSVVCTAKAYLGVQYRWGGKSSLGIDCSGLTSISYMQNGVLTYRDAQLKEGFPVHNIPLEQVKPGDLLYFPGHIAMYLGNQRYIHSTGRVGSGGVVINSFNPQDENFREDLKKSLYAAGSIF